MKRWMLTVFAGAILSACQWQQMPAWEALPGNDCELVSYRLGLPKGQAKAVKLRESEQEALRNYLQSFTEQGKHSLATFAPGTLLSGEFFALNFMPKAVVLNIGKRERVQYVKARTATDDALLQLLRRRSDSRQLKQATPGTVH